MMKLLENDGLVLEGDEWWKNWVSVMRNHAVSLFVMIFLYISFSFIFMENNPVHLSIWTPLSIHNEVIVSSL